MSWKQKYLTLLVEYTYLRNKYHKFIIENMIKNSSKKTNPLDRWYYDLDVNELEYVVDINIDNYIGTDWEYSYIQDCNVWWEKRGKKEKQMIFDTYTGK